MIQAKPLLKSHLSEEDYVFFSEQVAAGYKACQNTIKGNSVLENFLPGALLRSHMLTPFVDHALSKMKGFNYEFKANNPGNWFQTTFHKNGLALTSHYLGAGKGKRSFARKALVRGELNERNLSLFEEDDAEPDLDGAFGYCHLLHSGYIRPETISIAIPERSQIGYFAVSNLNIVEPKKADVEEIREEVIVKLLKLSDEKLSNERE